MILKRKSSSPTVYYICEPEYPTLSFSRLIMRQNVGLEIFCLSLLLLFELYINYNIITSATKDSFVSNVYREDLPIKVAKWTDIGLVRFRSRLWPR